MSGIPPASRGGSATQASARPPVPSRPKHKGSGRDSPWAERGGTRPGRRLEATNTETTSSLAGRFGDGSASAASTSSGASLGHDRPEEVTAVNTAAGVALSNKDKETLSKLKLSYFATVIQCSYRSATARRRVAMAVEMAVAAEREFQLLQREVNKRLQLTGLSPLGLFVITKG